MGQQEEFPHFGNTTVYTEILEEFVLNIIGQVWNVGFNTHAGVSANSIQTTVVSLMNTHNLREVDSLSIQMLWICGISLLQEEGLRSMERPKLSGKVMPWMQKFPGLIPQFSENSGERLVSEILRSMNRQHSQY